MGKKNIHDAQKSYRFKDNPTEQEFSEAWAAEQGSRDLLGYILGDGNSPASYTERDAFVAARVVQWLGTPVGMAFLGCRGFARIGGK